jgi:hypothetical protein
MPVTHEKLNGMPPWRPVAYLRDLLILHGVLPSADRNLALFERWPDETLASISRPGHRQVIERFASWHVRRRLRGFADRGPVTGKQTQQARGEVGLAIAAVPHQSTANPAPISQRQRLDLLQRLLTDEETELLTRVAAILMLLYAQPLTRILTLTLDDVLHERRMLHLAASLADRAPVSLGEAVTGIDDRNLTSC